jgi:hypothetical protein
VVPRPQQRLDGAFAVEHLPRQVIVFEDAGVNNYAALT